VLPTTAAKPTPAAAEFAIVDVDPAGRRLNPAEAQRKDVLFRRVDKQPAG